MLRRFYVDTPISSERVTLGGSEAHHLLHVLRAVRGDEVTLFDGSGQEYTARVEQLGRSQVELVITAACAVDREAACHVVVGVALPKGDRQRWLIEKLTEVGVARVVPLRCERSVVHPDQRGLAKLHRFVIETSKQCGRNRLMEVAAVVELANFVEQAPSTARRWMADPSSHSTPRQPLPQSAAYLAIGPEGGFSAVERQAAEAAGWQCVSLGPRTLRIETACTVLAALAAGNLVGGSDD